MYKYLVRCNKYSKTFSLENISLCCYCTVLSVHVKQSLFVLVALAVCVFAADEAQDQEAAEQYFLRYG